MKIFLVAGEESGDILGADLMSALKIKYPKTEFIFRGIGGARMESHGLNSLFPMQELSLMGIAEIVPQIPHLLKRITETADAVETFQPDIFLTIDAPDFSFRVAKQIKKRALSIPFKVHYVAPTVWAWRPKRAEKISKLYDAILCLFPFEPPYFEAEKMKAKFVGHPMSALLADVSKTSFIERHDLGRYSDKIGLLLGSRKSEVERMAPIFFPALLNVLRSLENPYVIIPTLPQLQPLIEIYLEQYNVKEHAVIISDREEKYQAMASCDAAMATSGTVGLELSVLGVPHVIAYRLNRLTYEIGKRLITTKYAHLTNIMLHHRIVPEFIQNDATPENISSNLIDLMHNKHSRRGQIEAFEAVRQKIKGADNLSPSENCAVFLMDQFSAS